jgi:hypothetical protein
VAVRPWTKGTGRPTGMADSPTFIPSIIPAHRDGSPCQGMPYIKRSRGRQAVVGTWHVTKSELDRSQISAITDRDYSRGYKVAVAVRPWTKGTGRPTGMADSPTFIPSILPAHRDGSPNQGMPYIKRNRSRQAVVGAWHVTKSEPDPIPDLRDHRSRLQQRIGWPDPPPAATLAQPQKMQVGSASTSFISTWKSSCGSGCGYRVHLPLLMI